MRKVLLALAAVVPLLAVACGGDHAAHTGSGDDRQAGTMDHGGTVPGAAADPADASRKILVEASDELLFEPSSIDIDAGDVVTFVVRNEGKMVHEFVLGDEAYQDEHKAAMQHGEGHMSELNNAVDVAPSETVKLTWRFNESGTVLYGCHEPGHYEGGMVGTITVG